jgi:hypothetical protein
MRVSQDTAVAIMAAVVAREKGQADPLLAHTYTQLPAKQEQAGQPEMALVAQAE